MAELRRHPALALEESISRPSRHAATAASGRHERTIERDHRGHPDIGEFFQRDRSIHPPAFTPTYKTSVLRSPRIPLWSLQNSLSEVTGPIFRRDELGPLDNDLIRNYAKDGEPSASASSCMAACSTRTAAACPTPWSSSGRPMPAGATGTRRTPISPPSIRTSAAADARSPTRTGYYWFRTIKPGAYPFRNYVNYWRPAHIHFSVFGSGFAQRLITQMYFEGDPLIRQ